MYKILVTLSLQEAANMQPFLSPDSSAGNYCLIDPSRCSRARLDSSLYYYMQRTDIIKDIISQTLDSLQKLKNGNDHTSGKTGSR